MRSRLLAGVAVATCLMAPSAALAGPSADARFSTFNASLNRSAAGQLLTDLNNPGGDSQGVLQAKNVAEVIQRTRPDVLLINEFDYYENGAAAEAFSENFLEVSQNGARPIAYPYSFVAPSNTGIPTGLDLDNSGSVGGPGDAQGFGFFPGQFGMVVYSKYPIVRAQVRTFQDFLWNDMPANRIPPGYYSPEELAVLRLSSKSHWDIPIRVDGRVVHFLTSHPTPPVFDGPEDRNGRRNADEIRFWADYVSPGRGGYIYDDRGRRGGLHPSALFVIAGDQNADPCDGDSFANAIHQLLASSRINAGNAPDSAGAVEAAQQQGGANLAHRCDPRFDTADFADTTPGNLRADYVLPRRSIKIVDSGVFWPVQSNPLSRLTGTFDAANWGQVGGFPTSDHRLVYTDLAIPGAGRG